MNYFTSADILYLKYCVNELFYHIVVELLNGHCCKIMGILVV